MDQMGIEESRADKFLMLTILHNMAMCYQSEFLMSEIGALEECALHLEGCMLNLQECFPGNLDDHPDEKVKKVKYECKAHMQVCALLSQLHRHKDALTHAEKASKLAHYLIHDVSNVVSHYVSRPQEGDKQAERPRFVSTDYFYDEKMSLLGRTAIKIKPIMDAVVLKLIPEDGAPAPQLVSEFDTSYDKVDMRNLLGYLNQSDWIWSLNIGNIM